MIIRNPPAWFRLLQVGIGTLSIILSMLAIAYPGLAAFSVIVLISIILLIIRIERVVIGMLSYSRPYSNEQSVTSLLFSVFFYWEKVFTIYKYRSWYNGHCVLLYRNILFFSTLSIVIFFSLLFLSKLPDLFKYFP